MSNLNTKRQLLADLIAGKTDALRTYQREQQQRDSPYGWIIDERPVGGLIMAHLKAGGQREMSKEEFEQLPSKIGIWTIRDFTGGKIPPPIDE